MFYADFRKAGYGLLRHHDRTFDLQYRLVSFACRIGGPDQGFGEGWDRYGLLQGVRQNWGNEETHGDITNWGMWPASATRGTATGVGLPGVGAAAQPPGSKQRTIPGWAQAWGAITQEASSPSDASQGGGANFPTTTTTGASTVDVLPVFSQSWDPDGRFEPKTVPLPPGVEDVPGGVGGVVVTGTDEYSQQDLFVPCMPNQLIAPHEDGLASHGTTVYDLTHDSKPDHVRRAKLQTLTRVFQIGSNAAPDKVLEGLCGKIGQHALAIQMGTTRGGTNSRGAFADDPFLPNTSFPQEVIGLASRFAGGPLNVGVLGDKHAFSPTGDKDQINSLHIGTNAYFFADVVHDAPLEFGGDWLPPGSAGPPWQTFLRYDPTQKHWHPKGQRQGLWRWETHVPVYYPPPPGGGTNTAANPDADHGGGVKPPRDDGGFSTNVPAIPDADQGKVGPDDGRKDPDADQARKDPSRDQGRTKTAAEDVGTKDPDADQARGDKVADDDQGIPTGATLRPFGPLIADGPVGPSKRPIDDLEPPPLPPSDSVLPRQPLATLNEFQVPGIVFRPQPFVGGYPDLRNSTTWTVGDSLLPDATWPTVARLEAFGGQATDGEFTYVNARGRYGPDSHGMVSVMPPNIGGEQIIAPGTTVAPELLSVTPTTSFNIYRSQLTFGTPLSSGLPGDGFAIHLSAGTLVVDTVASDGTVLSTGTLWPSAAGDIQSALDSIGATQGDVLYRSATAWTALGTGTAGQVLTAGGAAANPSWTTVSGSGGLTTGTDASRPATPTSVGDSYVVTDKLNGPTTPSGSLDPSTAFGIGLLDAKTWGFVAFINGWPQTVSSNWIFSGAPRITGTLDVSGSGTINATKIGGRDVVTSSPTNGQALVWNNGASHWAGAALGVAGGGTGVTTWGSTNGVLYGSGTTLTQTGAPDSRGGQVLVTANNSTTPTWDRKIGDANQTGSNTTGLAFSIYGGRGTGSADGGELDFYISLAAGAGSSANAGTLIAKLDGKANVVLAATGSALTTGATAGFTFLPTCAGTPTGTLANTYTGAAALVVDTTNNQLMYSVGSGTWVSLTSAAATPAWSTVLGAGNTSGGHDVIITSGDVIHGQDGSAGAGSVLTTRGGSAVGAANTVSGGLVLDTGACTGNSTNANAFTFKLSSGVVGGASNSTQNASATVWTIKGNNNTLSGAGNWWTINPTFADGGTTSSATWRPFFLNPTINASAASRTGVYEALIVDVTETSVPTGRNLIASFRVGGANKFTFQPDGRFGCYTLAPLAKGAVGSGTTLDATGTYWSVSGTASLTLPDSTTFAGGFNKLYWIQQTGSGTVTVSTTAGQTINGAATFTFSGTNETVAIYSDGFNWVTIGVPSLSSVLKIGNTTGATDLVVTGGQKLTLNGSSSGSTSIKAAATAAATYTLPASDGSSGQMISTDGAGTLSWATAAGTPPTVSTQTNNFSATGSNKLYRMDATSNAVAATLPAASSTSILYFKRIDSTANVVKIVAAGSDTIDGGTATSIIYILDQWDSVTLISDGTSSWSIV